MTMGFEAPETHIRLEFSDPSFSGLEVMCRLVPLGELTEAASLADVDPQNVRAEDLQKAERLVEAFAAALVSWNLTRKGKKVPATVAGVRSLDLVFVMQIITAWLEAVGKILTEQIDASDVDESSLPVEPL